MIYNFYRLNYDKIIIRIKLFKLFIYFNVFTIRMYFASNDFIDQSIHFESGKGTYYTVPETSTQQLNKLFFIYHAPTLDNKTINVTQRLIGVHNLFIVDGYS